METTKKRMEYEERAQKSVNGWVALIIITLLYIGALALTVAGGISMETEESALGLFMLIIGIIWLCVGWFPYCGLHVIKTNEAMVLTLFGKYVGTLKEEGFYTVPDMLKDAMNKEF
mgnify:CR=1 FL=1